MGLIFTWDAVSKGEIPTATGFTETIADIRIELERAPFITAALLFGSAIRPSFNVRSDIDCAVLYDARREGEAVALLQMLSRRAKQHYVPVGFSPLSDRTAATAFHLFGPAFLRHLEGSIACGGLIKGDFVGPIAPSISERMEVGQWIRGRLFSLTEGFIKYGAHGPERQAAFLTKAYETPMHLARKMLVVMGAIGTDDSKPTVKEVYGEWAAPWLNVLFHELLEIDDDYSRFLTKQLESPSHTAYHTHLDMLARNVRKVIRFVSHNIDLLSSGPAS